MIYGSREEKVCWIVGAGPCGGLKKEGFVPETGDYIIASDGGLRYLETAGVKPDMIVGDFDTLGYEPEHENVVRLQVMKDWTDTFVAMEKGIAMGYKTFVFFGCLGGKLEHTVANLQHLSWLAERGCRGWMTDGRVWAAAICGGTPACGSKSAILTLPAQQSGMVSVFAMGGPAEGVAISGLKYGLQEGKLSSSFPLGVSNEFTGEKGEIGVKKGTLLIMAEIQGPVIE